MPDRGHELVDLFVRDLDQIELPPRDRWRPAQRKESYLMKTSRYVLYAGAVAAVLAAALIVGLGLGDRNSEVATSPSPIPATSTPIPASSAPATPSPVATASPVPTAQPGAITGRFGYGSDFIPANTVYAISTTDSRIWYSVDFAGLGNPPRPTAPPGTSGDTYTITSVAPGTYWVVAYRNDAQGPDPGFYSRAAACLRIPNSGGCPDQTLIPATVIAGQTTSGIDVVVWGPPRDQPLPTLPPRPTADSGLVNVCGAFNAYMPASSGRNAVLSMGTPNGLMNFELVLTGTVPPNLQQDGAGLVRLTGRRVQGINTVADYNVVRVSSCSTP